MSESSRKAQLPPTLRDSLELSLVEAFYGTQRAKRSGVPLIHHIYEGALIMAAAGATTLAQRAFCLHPLVQNDADLHANYYELVFQLSGTKTGMLALVLAMEYRSVANEYLAHKPMQPGGIRLSPLLDVNYMLLGDKVQNQRDFLAYHSRSHPNAERLAEYFEQWVAALLPACGSLSLAELTAGLPEPEPFWRSPLPLQLVPTADSLSFKNHPTGTTGLPHGEHPGAFGVRRKHHIHEGVDLYCPQGTPVHAVEGGEVVAVMPFTGMAAGMAWWLDTDVVMVEGLSGVVAYGEVASAARPGQRLQTGDLVGHVRQVLKTDKGRPMSMLHLELHDHGTCLCPEWPVGAPKPHTLQDPTPLLMSAALSAD